MIFRLFSFSVLFSFFFTKKWDGCRESNIFMKTFFVENLFKTIRFCRKFYLFNRKILYFFKWVWSLIKKINPKNLEKCTKCLPGVRPKNDRNLGRLWAPLGGEGETGPPILVHTPLAGRSILQILIKARFPCARELDFRNSPKTGSHHHD